jgi:hypothetical protein
VLELSIPPLVTIPLERNQLNTVTVPVTVRSDVSWGLAVGDTGPVAGRGHMRGVDQGPVALEGAMRAVVGPPSPVDLSLSQEGLLTTGSGDTSVPVVLSQPVGPLDRPGSYSIQLLFTAISGF